MNTKKYCLLYLTVLTVLLGCNKNKDPKPDNSGKFIKFFGTAGMNQAYTLLETSDGFVLGGYSIKDGRTDKDILIVKTDKNGNKLWEKRIETGYDEIARDIKEINGQIAITGMQVQSNGESQAILITMENSGQIADTKLFGSVNVSEDAYHISKLENGDYLIGGVKDSSGDRNMYLTRISDTVVWEFNMGNMNSDDIINRVLELSDGDLIWCGTSKQSGFNNIRCTRSNSSGVIKWSYDYELNSTDEYGRNIEATHDGNLIIAGSKGTENSGSENLLLMKINENGYKAWESQPVSGNSGGYSIRKVSTGGFIVAGFKQAENATDQLLLRLNDSGGTIWEKTFGGSRNDQGRIAIECSDGFFAMAGYVDLYDDKNNVFQLVKVDSNGEINK